VAKLSAVTTPSLTYDEGAAPSTPAAGKVIQYAKTDGLLYSKDDAGTETALGSVTFSGVRAIANAVTAVANNTWTSIALAGTDRFDTNSYHDPASNNTRLTVPAGKAGKYLIGANVAFASSATGERAARIFLNNTTRIHDEMRTAVADAALPTRITVVTLYDLAVADYVEVQLWQDSGGSINSQNDANSTCEFWMYRVG
jgi:hypothetical protein